MDKLWIIIFIIAIAVEFFTPSALVSIWFAFGALFALLCAWFEIDITIQWIAFVLVSVSSFLVIRPLAQKYLKYESMPTNMDRLIGKTFIIEADVPQDQIVQQKVFNQIWSFAEVNRNPLKQGEVVEILAIEGVKLIVRKTN